MGILSYARAASLLVQMKRDQWKSGCEIESLQEERLGKLLRYAKENVPYYHKRLKGPSVRSFEDLGRIPITPKEDVRENPDSFLSMANRKEELYRMLTSGSTGAPMGVFYDGRDSAYGFALRFHSFTECGFGPSDLLANIMLSRLQPFPMQRFMYRVRNLNPLQDEKKILGELAGIRPDIIVAYPSTLSLLADMNPPGSSALRLKRIISASEQLTEKSREAISKSFGCDVRNYYGSNESWALGWECEMGSLHINSDSAIIDIVDDDGRPVSRGQPGNVLLTSLWRYSMPFIRYAIGDRAAFGPPCKCGRGTHVLKSLEGRGEDIVILPSGKRFMWFRLELLIKNLPGVLRYQGIQPHRGALRIQVIPERDAPQNLEKRISGLLHGALPEPMEIEVCLTGSIPRGKGGKMAAFVSRIGHEAQ